MGLAYPPEMLVVPSPIAIFKGTPNLKAAQKFVDFLLSKDGQTIVASEGTLPIRADVAVDTTHGLVKADEAVKRAMKADYLKVMAEKEADHPEVHPDHAVAPLRRGADRAGRWGARRLAAPPCMQSAVPAGAIMADVRLENLGGGLRDPPGLRRLHADHPGRRVLLRSSGPRGAGRPWCCG